jgi:preprotein translocase subunit SecY
MRHLASALSALLTGALVGLAGLFLVLVTVTTIAYVAEFTVWIPGLYSAWFGVENGMTALHFDPNGQGMLTVILAAALLNLALSASIRRSSPRNQLGGENP